MIRETDRRLRRVSSILPLDCLMRSSRIEEGIRTPLGSPNFLALSSDDDEPAGLFTTFFFGIGDDFGDDNLDGVDDDVGEVFGDDGEAFLRGMETSYSDLTVSAFAGASLSPSCFTAVIGAGSVFKATGGVASGVIAATIDLVTRVGLLDAAVSSFLVFSSSLLANKLSSSELAADAAASVSSLDMIKR